MKSKRIISALLTLVMIVSLVPTFTLTAFAENDNIELTVNIQPLKTSKSITISENAEYTELKSKIEEELKVDFDKDGYGIYCPEARIYYHPSSQHYKVDETQTLKALNFKTGYTVNLEKLSWTGTTGNPIHVMGLNISGGVGACGSFYSGTSAEVDYDWNYSLKYITIRTETPITISGTAEEDVNIVVNAKNANLTISDLTLINNSSSCIHINSTHQLNLTVLGNNTFTSTGKNAQYTVDKVPAITLANDSSKKTKLSIQKESTGKLTATTNVSGQPGIGTANDTDIVNGVEINGGTIIATGGTGAAGIRAQRIWIYGGNVTANGGLSAKSVFKIENATVTANSDTQVFSGILKPTINGQYNAVASVNKDGTETEIYDAMKGNTYKYFKVIPKTEVSLTVDEPQEYTYDGAAKTFNLPNDALDGFSVTYEQNEIGVEAPTNAGSYDVIITRAEDDTYKSYSKTIKNGLVIKQKSIADAVITLGAGLTYTGSEQMQTIASVTVGNLTLIKDTDYTVSDNTATDAGSGYELTVTGIGNFMGTAEKPFTIAQATNGFTAPLSIAGWTYGETANQPTATTKFGTPTYAYATEENGTYTAPAPTDAGTYWVQASVAGTGNYTGISDKKSFTVLPKRITREIGLTAPVAVEAPITTLETTEYTASITWSPRVIDEFYFDTVYTALVTITPKTNYTTDGIGENEYVIANATVTNAANADTLTAVFAKTEPIPAANGNINAKYTVRFEVNGGSKVASQTVAKNGTATEPKNPTKDGYVFDGWYTDSKFTTEYDFDTKVTKNITLYAKWVADEVQEPSDDKKDDTNDKKDDNKNDNKDDGNKPTPDEWENPFDDVKENEWYFDDVKYANENGLMSGITNSIFAPNENITRGMFVTVLYRAEGEPAVNKSIPFADVKANMYYANAVIWAEQNDIAEGYSETEFAPDENITREQIAAILYRYAKFKGYDVTQGGMQIREYEDFESISDYAINAMTWAVNTGLMKGKTNTTLNPKDNATRAEIAAILNRFIENNK